MNYFTRLGIPIGGDKVKHIKKILETTELKEIIADLKCVKNELAAPLKAVTISEDHIFQRETYCAENRELGENITFEVKQRSFELLDVRGTLALEGDERVLYIRCQVGKQRVVH